ncbi:MULTISPECIES: hypothetical protein [Cyanophyceae]|nr:MULTISPECIES: hypothetical protein [Cyanophyceae]AHJ31509.1 hypothetical protein NSP_52210 [Nodularia spumigena CCY9414]MDB9357362.1 hypothetical protein [Nodularia spumigena CS-587/03]MDB9337655.1 hypothetical protein [Nodularia spumigena CS-589/07]MDB9399514.1 hypothetical protein [Microcystis aeruginosa CS-567/02-A1]MDB9500467.1 hypothetical protein [Nodularia spumigena CS-336/02]
MKFPNHLDFLPTFAPTLRERLPFGTLRERRMRLCVLAKRGVAHLIHI